MFGSIAGAESLVLAFDEAGTRVRAVMAEAPHGTAPGLQGRNVANPMAMIWPGPPCSPTWARRRPIERRAPSTRQCSRRFSTAPGPPDIGGHATTTDLTDEVIRRVKSKLELWSTLG